MIWNKRNTGNNVKAPDDSRLMKKYTESDFITPLYGAFGRCFVEVRSLHASLSFRDEPSIGEALSLSKKIRQELEKDIQNCINEILVYYIDELFEIIKDCDTKEVFDYADYVHCIPQYLSDYAVKENEITFEEIVSYCNSMTKKFSQKYGKDIFFDPLPIDQRDPEAEVLRRKNHMSSAVFDTCYKPTLYYRDVNLPTEITDKYKVGMIIRNRLSVEATALLGGFCTTHRYMILSNYMMRRYQSEDYKKCAHFYADTNSRFLVLGRAADEGKRVTILLHLGRYTWQYFKSVDMESLRGLVNSCFDIFRRSLKQEPIASVSTKEWLKQCEFQIGINARGELIPVEDEVF